MSSSWVLSLLRRQRNRAADGMLAEGGTQMPAGVKAEYEESEQLFPRWQRLWESVLAWGWGCGWGQQSAVNVG